MRRIVAGVLLAAGLVVPAVTAPSYAAKPRCHGQVATIVGTDRADRIKGTPGDDVIVGRGGKDVIDGRGGTDLICGEGGNDRLTSGDGGLSTLDGGPGKDELYGHGADDELLGGSGNDKLHAIFSEDGPNRLVGGTGDDFIAGSEFADVILGGAGDDTIYPHGGADLDVRGGAGNDWIEGEGADLIHGDGGNDVINSGPGGSSTLYGDAGNDSITVAAPEVIVSGGPGDDVLTGGPHDDTLNGDGGNDRISAGGGADLCWGGEGTDTCHGGAPGGQENTASDPDECDAETKYSCKGEFRPDRWQVQVKGKATYEFGDRYVTDWSFTTQVVYKHEYHDIVQMIDDNGVGHGEFHTQGTSGGCPVAGSSEFDGSDLYVLLTVDYASGTWGWDWFGPGSSPSTKTCPDRTYQVTAPTGIKDMESGIPFKPDHAGVLSGSRTEQRDHLLVEYSWTISPIV